MEGLEILRNGALELGIRLDDFTEQKFSEYTSLLRVWNRRINLVSRADSEEIYKIHYLDSLWCRRGVNLMEIERLLDLGSGAGFPGIPLKLCFPHLRVTLLEARGKRCLFLKEVVNNLRLQGCQVIQGRAEEVAHHQGQREGYDCVVARALSSLPVLLELALPFLKTGGRLVALKGRDISQELTEAGEAARMLGGELAAVVPYRLGGGDLRHVVSYVKKGETPAAYPRRTGVPGRRPLGLVKVRKE